MTLELCIANKYKLLHKLGRGGFAVVYRAVDTSNGTEVAVKLEHNSVKPPYLGREIALYNMVQRHAGMPRIYWDGNEGEYHALAFQLLGPSLYDLFAYCDCQFSVKTVAMLATQIITRLRSLHSKQILHRDISPSNFLMGTGRQGNTLFITDFGLAYHEDAHTVALESGGLLGTARYTSIKSHKGEVQSARDDLESAGYMLINFLRGKVPWMGCAASNSSAKDAVRLRVKDSIDISGLCDGCPPEMAQYFEHLRGLKDGQKPNYTYLLSLFSKQMKRLGYEWDNVYDWTEKLYYAQAAAQEAGSDN